MFVRVSNGEEGAVIEVFAATLIQHTRDPTHDQHAATTSMTTPWERIEDEDYRIWLLKRQITAGEYNTVSVVDRRDLRTRFDDAIRLQELQQKNNGKL